MTVRETILQKITNAKLTAEPVTVASDLYADLGFDSLAFVQLLLEIEGEYPVTFSIVEMEECLQVGNLIELVENRIKEQERNYD